MRNGRLQIGIIGCSGIAEGKHLPALKKQSGRCEITAFCDIAPERAEKARREYGTADAKVFTDYRDLLRDAEVDAVHILTPNATHADIAVAAFEAGKHVMCEKPMAANVKDAERMVEAWKKSGKKFTIGYQNRFRPEVLKLRSVIDEGGLGEVYFGKAHAVRRRAVPNWGVFTDPVLQGGGPLIDIGTHALDLALWLMNNYEPARVSGSVFRKLGNLPEAVPGNEFGPWDPDTFGVEDSAMGYIVMKNGASIFLESSWALNVSESREASATLCGTKAGAELFSSLDPSGDRLLISRTDGDRLVTDRIVPAEDPELKALYPLSPGDAECSQWLDAILCGSEPLVKPEEALTVTRILEAIYRSAETGKEVVFE